MTKYSYLSPIVLLCSSRAVNDNTAGSFSTTRKALIGFNNVQISAPSTCNDILTVSSSTSEVHTSWPILTFCDSGASVTMAALTSTIPVIAKSE